MIQLCSKVYNKQIQNVESTCFIHKISTNLNVRTNLDLPKNKPWQGGKSQTAQGGAERNPGINASNHILYDSHRDDGVSVETDGIVVAMTFPETSLHWRICHSVPERHIRQCRSWSMSFDVLSPGLRCAHPGLSRRNGMKTELSDSCRSVRACFPINLRFFSNKKFRVYLAK